MACNACRKTPPVAVRQPEAARHAVSQIAMTQVPFSPAHQYCRSLTNRQGGGRVVQLVAELLPSPVFSRPDAPNPRVVSLFEPFVALHNWDVHSRYRALLISLTASLTLYTATPKTTHHAERILVELQPKNWTVNPIRALIESHGLPVCIATKPLLPHRANHLPASTREQRAIVHVRIGSSHVLG